jgi:hypothetical protein
VVDLEIQEMAPLDVSLGSNSQGDISTSKQLQSDPKMTDTAKLNDLLKRSDTRKCTPIQRKLF